MSFRKRNEAQGADARREGEVDPILEVGSTAGEGEAQPGPALSEIDQLRAERDEAIESWQRARADYQNLRRRQQADIDAAVARSREALLAELLLVVDTLDMALSTPCQTEEARNLQYGVQLTRQQLMQFLELQNVTRLPDAGTFDPRYHQAIATVVSDRHAPGEIVATVRRGYLLGERVLRHAQVQVAADPAGEPERPTPPAEDEGSRADVR